MDKLIEWCTTQGLMINENQEVFFVNEKLLMRPAFLINKNVYIDLMDEVEMTEKYLDFCRQFSASYGTLIVIPRNALDDDSIMKVTKHDIESKFNMSFNGSR